MPDTLIAPGSRKTVMASASRAAGTHNGDAFQLGRPGNGVIITVIVTNVGTGGSLDTLNIQAKDGDNYDTILQFATQAITAVGRYRYRIAPGTTVAAGSNAYKGVSENLIPAQCRIQAVHTVDAMIYQIKVEGL